MKKRILALLCALTLLVSAVPGALALSGERSRSSDILYTLGLVRDTDARYNLGLEAYASRLEAAELLVRLSGGGQEAREQRWLSGFLDIPHEKEYILDYAARRGWVSGYTPVKFAPEEGIAANAWCAFLLRMLGYTEKAGDFATDGASRFARHIGLTDRDYHGILTRGDLQDIAKKALLFHYKDSEDTILSRMIDKGAISRAAANAVGLLDPELSAREVADRCAAAVFQIDSYEKKDSVKKKEPDSNASGFFIDKSGIAVTNYHSIEDSIYSVATLITGEQYEVESVLYYDKDIDIAVCQISDTELTSKQKTSAFASLEMVGTEELYMGDKVYTISNPLGTGIAISEGIVSDPSRSLKSYKLPCVMNTADITEGSSGGALLNVYGQVIGITTGAYTYGNNMYLAVPVNPAMIIDLTENSWTLKEVRDIERAKMTAAED